MKESIGRLDAYILEDEFYKRAMYAMSNPIFITDTKMRILFMNKAAEKNCAMSFEECRGKTCAIFNTPLCNTDDCCIKKFRRGEPEAVQYNPEGKAQRVSFSILYDADGNEEGFISVSVDISEILEAQRQLKISEERYKTAFRQMKDVVWEYDIKTKTMYQSERQNGTLEEDFGIGTIVQDAPESLIEKGFIHPESADTFRKMFQTVVSGEKQNSCTVKYKSIQGSYRWLKLTCSTVYDVNGIPIKAIGSSRDITDQKELELQYVREKEYRTSLLTDAVCVYEINLSRNTLIQLDINWAESLGISEDASYTELVDIAKEKVVHPDYRQFMQDKLGRKELIALYQTGQSEVHCEYKRIGNSGRMIWVLCSVFLTCTQDTGDICAFIYLKDVDEKKKREIELTEKAEMDMLTGFYNRRTAQDLIAQELSYAEKGTGALLIIDMDNFKMINDTYGHLYGDAVLTEIAQKISKFFRKEDIRGRLGGDEFIIFIRDVSDEEAVFQKAEHICDNLQTIYSSNDHQVEVSASIGISFSPIHGEDFSTLYEHADIALYHVKNEGKNHYDVYHNGMKLENPQLLDLQKKGASPIEQPLAGNVVEFLFKRLSHTTDMEASITSVLELLGKHYLVQRCYIVEYVNEWNTYALTFEWCEDGVDSLRRGIKRLHLGQLHGYQNLFDREGILCVENMEHADSLVQDIARRSGAKAILQVILNTDGAFRGLLGIDDRNTSRYFNSRDKETMRVVSEIVGTFLGGKRREEEKDKHTSILKSVLDGQETALFILDPETRELLYLNKRGRELFPQLELGNYCFKTAFYSSDPTASCPVDQLIERESECEKMRILDEEKGIWWNVSFRWSEWVNGKKCIMVTCM